MFSRSYGYDAADQITRIEDEARGARAYQYDACERLLAVDGSDPERFVVDPAGNLLAADASHAPAPNAAEPDAAPGDRLRRFRGRDGERTFAYDAHGNRVGERRAGGAEAVAYRYGADDRLREVRRAGPGGGRVTRFGYDALGRRVWKAAARLTGSATLAAGAASAGAAAPPEPAAGAWTRTAFVWSGDVLLAESDRAEADALATVYAYEPGGFRPLAQARRETADADAAVYHYHLDHLGTPHELTDGLGTVVWQAEYRAWGAVARARVAEVAQPLRFQGQYADGETGLHYNRHRYYSPAEGRFVTQDPIGLAGGVNIAAYAPNPVAWVDPLGLNSIDHVDPNTVNFSQRTVGGQVTEYTEAMRTGNWDWSRSGPLRVMDVDGQLVSYDNRRLMAARQAGVGKVPVSVVDPEAIMPGSQSTWAKKFSARLNDPRNAGAGGRLPAEGSPDLPSVACKF